MRNNQKRLGLWITVLLVVLIETGCGGGGGGTTSSTPPPTTSTTCVWDQSTSTWDNCTYGS